VKAILFVLLVFTSCASSPPPKDFKVTLYQAFSDTGTIERKQDDGTIHVIYAYDPEFNAFIAMPVDQWTKQLKYEKLLIKECAVWR